MTSLASRRWFGRPWAHCVLLLGQPLSPTRRRPRTNLFSTSTTDKDDQHGDLRSVLAQVAAGALAPSAAAARLEPLLVSCGTGAEQIGGFARIDHDRARRTGFPEVVFGEGKTADQLVSILESMIRNSVTAEEQLPREAGGEETHGRVRAPVVATRVSPEKWASISNSLEGLRYHPEARTVVYKGGNGTSGGLPGEGKTSWTAGRESIGKVAVLSAGTSDLNVAEEAAVLSEAAGAEVLRFHDVGVAGLHRLLRIVPLLRGAGVVVCVAGMDGALPGVVAGLVPCPVVAVPTSVGYGAAMAGIGPLMTMLNACAPGVAVVNIDNGFGAAAFAVKMLLGNGGGGQAETDGNG
ncbi:unnamed protein product [Discosporangium mesarthrocarpum]